MADAQPSSIWDFFSSPAGQGLLGAVASGMAGARRGQPINSIGSGLMGGLHAYGQAQQNQIEQAHANTAQQMADLQLKQAQQAQADQDQMRTLAKQYYSKPTMTMGDVMSAPGQAGPTTARAQLLPNTQGTFDTNGFVNAMMGVDPLKGMQLKASLVKEMPFDKFKPENYTPESVALAMNTGDVSKLVRQDKLHFADNGGSLVGLNPYTGQQVSTTDKSGNPFEDLVVRGPDGRLVPNQALVGAKSQIANAGRPLTSVQVNNKMGESVAQQVGPMMKESYDAATAAQNQIGVANRLIAAIDSGKALTGPGASFKLGAYQLGQSLGLVGKDAQDTILNTRSAIQALGQSTLSARAQLKGQGQVSDYEGKLIEKASSGNIDDMTGPEIKQLANLNKRLSNQIIKQHQYRVKSLGSQDGLGALAGMYDIPPADTMYSTGDNAALHDAAERIINGGQ